MKKIVIISGITGAGKTTAANILEDMGYLCIDQYPVELLENLIDLIIEDTSSKYQRVALTIPITDLDKYEHLLSNSELKPVLILLDASVKTIVNRYKFTRRVHPFLVSNKADSLLEAVEIEKAIFKRFASKSSYIIDTTDLSLSAHRNELEKILGYDSSTNLAITFMSFGYKYGVPQDADIVFDVRFLDNPFYDPELKTLTGNDKPVQDFVLRSKRTEDFLKRLYDYLDFTLESYDNEEKRHLTIDIGCTGGQHRSVTIANVLYDHYKDKYTCYKRHRELEEHL